MTTNSLNSYPAASFKELWTISLPLMLTALSGNLMLFCDRLILSRYSVEAMNATASAGMVVALFVFGAVAIASIAEVFVGQYNGAGHFSKLAEPVWQMIWFSVFTWLLYLPLALWLGDFILPTTYKEFSLPYFQLLMLFGPLLSMISALSAFYIGQGKVKLVTVTALLGNILNIILDYLLIFGIEGIIPEMGTTGAAIGTVASQITQVILLFGVFLNSQNRKKYRTWQLDFKIDIFWQCLRIGFPSAVAHMLEIGAWTLELWMLATLKPAYITVVTIGQSIYILFAFIAEGLQKGVIAVASNLIGAQKIDLIAKALKSGIQLQLVMSTCLAIPLVIYPELLINCFFNEGQILDTLIFIKPALFWVWIFIVFDGLVWVLAGILTASGDTKFVMILQAASAWFFCLMPIYIIVVRFEASPEVSWILTAVYGALNALCFYLRYHNLKWKNLKII